MSSRLLHLAAAAGLLLLFAAPPAVRAGVPRACIHPHNHPLECPRATRREHRDVLPLQRLRALDAQRRTLERRIPLQDAERNRLLEDIREQVRPRRLQRPSRLR